MKTYARLTVSGSEAQWSAFVDAFEARIANTPGWHRATEKEQWLQQRGGAPLRCLGRDATSSHGAALVWIDLSGCALRVTNVTPTASGELSIEGYNAVLRELHDAVCAPSAHGLSGIRVMFDDGEDALRDRVPPEVARALEAFARAANHETGASHPYDRDRWLAFELAAHRADASLGADLLARWLREEGGFSFDVAEHLAEQYEHARALLKKSREQDAA